jgi:glyoxylase-like metal-dependent hydrolase (beta-lactamase superfamily II)
VKTGRSKTKKIIKMIKDLVKEVSLGAVMVLRPGNEEETQKGFYAPASISLIRCLPQGHPPKSGLYTLVDCGAPGEEELIKNYLREEGISLNRIGQVLITHNHPDHNGNVNLFRRADIITPDSIFDVNLPNFFKLIPSDFYQRPGNEYTNNLLIDQIKLVSTPGHSGWDYSVINSSSKGDVAIVGDLFWSEEDFENDSEFMELCVNPEMQKRSRAWIREILRPDVIIPGHGEAFAPKY